MNQQLRDNTVRITIKVFGGLRELFAGGTPSLQFSTPASLETLLKELGITHPQLAAKLTAGLASGYLNALVNGRNARFLQGRETILQEDDTVAFLPPVGGG